MSGSSCSCRVTYDLPESEESGPEAVESEHSSEEEETGEVPEEPAEESVLPTLKQFLITPEETYLLDFDEMLFIRERESSKVVGKMEVFCDSDDGYDRFVVGYRGELPVQEKIHTSLVIGIVKFDFDILDQVREEEHMDKMRKESVRHRLQTRWEQKTESYLCREEHSYSSEETVLPGQESRYTREEFKDLLTVSANILLLRQFARRDFIGRKHLRYIHLNGDFCQMEYKAYPFEIVQLNKRFCSAKRVRRRIIMPNGELTECNSYLSERGQLLLLSWPGENFFAAVDGRADISTDGGKGRAVPKDPADLVPLRERIQQHPILRSILEEETNRCSQEGERYASGQSELRAILSQLSRTLLLYKPHKVVHFVRRNIAPYL